MSRSLLFLTLFLLIVFVGCQKAPKPTLKLLLQNSPQIEGKAEYLNSPFVTAGNRVYMVGHQDGSFPELGWHIKGEMGGIWDHPIKLMDGFSIDLMIDNEAVSIGEAQSFVNFPMANRHHYELESQNLELERWQFVPDDKEGIIIQLLIKNTGKARRKFDLKFTGHSDLRPTWLAERLNIEDAQDEAIYNKELDAWIVQDQRNTWYSIFGADEISSAQNSTASKHSGKGVSKSLNYPVDLMPGKTYTINFVIAGSYTSQDAAKATYQDLHQRFISLFRQKQIRYADLASNSRLNIPDKDIQEAYEWLKYNCDWLVRKVPEIGTGIGAGIPDYPWWFGVDSEYALKGYMAIGQYKPVYQTIALLDSLSMAANGNGRIVHEVSTNGVVFNEGNINETPQFASLVWEVYLWNGDRDFLKRYYPDIKMGLSWLLEDRDNNDNLFPDGFGMMEIHGLDSEMIDVASYTQKGFADAANIARELGEQEIADSYQNTAEELRRNINERFWSEEFNSFADFIGTDKQALELIEDAIVRADTLKKPWAVEELEKTKEAIMENPSDEPQAFVLHHNWVVNTPMEMGIADKDKALLALKTAEKFVNPFGVFVTGIDRDESAGSDDGSFKGSKVFSYTGAVMTLPTGVQIIAENNYGRPNQALNYLKRMSRTFSYALPGSIYEVSPDYGMITQAWNIYGFAIPMVQQFFGIKPKAQAKRVVIRPQMPDNWDEAVLENVKVADNAVSIFYQKKDGKLSLKVNQTNTEWTVEIIWPIQMGKLSYELEQSSIQGEEKGGNLVFETQESEIEVALIYK